MTTGTIKKLVSERGFGFIAGADGKEYFFHRNELGTSSDFDRLIGGERVEFGGFEFTVIRADKRRIDALQVQREDA